MPVSPSINNPLSINEEELIKQCNEFLITERTLIEKGNKLNILSLEKKIEYNLEIEGLTW